MKIITRLSFFLLCFSLTAGSPPASVELRVDPLFANRTLFDRFALVSIKDSKDYQLPPANSRTDEKLNVSCRVRSKPQITITWTIDGIPLNFFDLGPGNQQPPARLYSSNEEYISSFTVTPKLSAAKGGSSVPYNSFFPNVGLFECRAINVDGEASARAFINLNVRPQVRPFFGQSNPSVPHLANHTCPTPAYLPAANVSTPYCPGATPLQSQVPDGQYTHLAQNDKAPILAFEHKTLNITCHVLGIACTDASTCTGPSSSNVLQSTFREDKLVGMYYLPRPTWYAGSKAFPSMLGRGSVPFYHQPDAKLSLERVEVSDTVEYECRVPDGGPGNSESKASVLVQIYTLPELAVVQNPGFDKDGHIALKCEIKGGNIIQQGAVWWYQNGIDLSTQTNHFRVQFMMDTLGLTILNSSLISEQRPFVCRGSNSAGFAFRSITAYFTEKTQWKKTPEQQVSVILGEYVQLRCEADGQPRPLVAWYYVNGTATLPSTSDISKLSGIPIENWLPGLQYSTDLQTQYQVLNDGTANPTTAGPAGSALGRFGASASSSKAVPQNLLALNGVWLVNANQTLYISEAKYAHRGAYICLADNTVLDQKTRTLRWPSYSVEGMAGTLKAAIWLQINLPASVPVKSVSKSATVGLNKNLKLECPVIGDPQISIEWQHFRSAPGSGASSTIENGGTGTSIVQWPAPLLDSNLAPVPTPKRQGATVAPSPLTPGIAQTQPNLYFQALEQINDRERCATLTQLGASSGSSSSSSSGSGSGEGNTEAVREIVGLGAEEDEAFGIEGADRKGAGGVDHYVYPFDVCYISRLVIVNVSRELNGTIMCSASNSYRATNLSLATRAVFNASSRTGALSRTSMLFSLRVQEPPDQVREITFSTYSNNTALLGWTAPFDGNDPITKYWIRHKLSTQTWSTINAREYLVRQPQSQSSSDSVNTTGHSAAGQFFFWLDNLQPYRHYDVHIQASNAIGNSTDPSDAESTNEFRFKSEATRPSAAPVDVLVFGINTTALEVQWKPPRAGLNGPLRSFSIRYREESSQEMKKKQIPVPDDQSEPGSDSIKGYSHILTDLSENTAYFVTVSVRNSRDEGPESPTIKAFTLEPVPSQPPHGVRCTASSSSEIALEWQTPNSYRAPGVLASYRIYYRPIKRPGYFWPLSSSLSAGRHIAIKSPLSSSSLLWEDDEDESNMSFISVPVAANPGASVSATLRNLDAFTNYSIQILAATRLGLGVRSAPIRCLTKNTTSSEPQDFNVVALNLTTFFAYWNPPAHSNGNIDIYKITVKTGIAGIATGFSQENSFPSSNLFYIGTTSHSQSEFLTQLKVTAYQNGSEGKSSNFIPLNNALGFNQASYVIVSNPLYVVAIKGETVELPCDYLPLSNIPLSNIPLSSFAPEWNRQPPYSQQYTPSEANPLFRRNPYIISSAQPSDSGTYTCSFPNAINVYLTGARLNVTHILQVRELPSVPAPPTRLKLISQPTHVNQTSVQLEWQSGSNHGSPLTKFDMSCQRLEQPNLSNFSKEIETAFQNYQHSLASKDDCYLASSSGSRIPGRTFPVSRDINSTTRTYLFRNLNCGWKYQIEIGAHNARGSSEPSTYTHQFGNPSKVDLSNLIHSFGSLTRMDIDLALLKKNSDPTMCPYTHVGLRFVNQLAPIVQSNWLFISLQPDASGPSSSGLSRVRSKRASTSLLAGSLRSRVRRSSEAAPMPNPFPPLYCPIQNDLVKFQSVVSLHHLLYYNCSLLLPSSTLSISQFGDWNTSRLFTVEILLYSAMGIEKQIINVTLLPSVIPNVGEIKGMTSERTSVIEGIMGWLIPVMMFVAVMVILFVFLIAFVYLRNSHRFMRGKLQSDSSDSSPPLTETRRPHADGSNSRKRRHNHRWLPLPTFFSKREEEEGGESRHDSRAQVTSSTVLANPRSRQSVGAPNAAGTSSSGANAGTGPLSAGQRSAMPAGNASTITNESGSGIVPAPLGKSSSRERARERDRDMVSSKRSIERRHSFSGQTVSSGDATSTIAELADVTGRAVIYGLGPNGHIRRPLINHQFSHQAQIESGTSYRDPKLSGRRVPHALRMELVHGRADSGGAGTESEAETTFSGFNPLNGVSMMQSYVGSNMNSEGTISPYATFRHEPKRHLDYAANSSNYGGSSKHTTNGNERTGSKNYTSTSQTSQAQPAQAQAQLQSSLAGRSQREAIYDVRSKRAQQGKSTGQSGAGEGDDRRPLLARVPGQHLQIPKGPRLNRMSSTSSTGTQRANYVQEAIRQRRMKANERGARAPASAESAAVAAASGLNQGNSAQEEGTYLFSTNMSTPSNHPELLELYEAGKRCPNGVLPPTLFEPEHSPPRSEDEEDDGEGDRRDLNTNTDLETDVFTQSNGLTSSALQSALALNSMNTNAAATTATAPSNANSSGSSGNVVPGAVGKMQQQTSNVPGAAPGPVPVNGKSLESCDSTDMGIVNFSQRPPLSNEPRTATCEQPAGAVNTGPGGDAQRFRRQDSQQVPSIISSNLQAAMQFQQQASAQPQYYAVPSNYGTVGQPSDPRLLGSLQTANLAALPQVQLQVPLQYMAPNITLGPMGLATLPTIILDPTINPGLNPSGAGLAGLAPANLGMNLNVNNLMSSSYYSGVSATCDPYYTTYVTDPNANQMPMNALLGQVSGLGMQLPMLTAPPQMPQLTQIPQSTAVASVMPQLQQQPQAQVTTGHKERKMRQRPSQVGTDAASAVNMPQQQAQAQGQAPQEQLDNPLSRLQRMQSQPVAQPVLQPQLQTVMSVDQSSPSVNRTGRLPSTTREHGATASMASGFTRSRSRDRPSIVQEAGGMGLSASFRTTGPSGASSVVNAIPSMSAHLSQSQRGTSKGPRSVFNSVSVAPITLADSASAVGAETRSTLANSATSRPTYSRQASKGSAALQNGSTTSSNNMTVASGQDPFGQRMRHASTVGGEPDMGGQRIIGSRLPTLASPASSVNYGEGLGAPDNGEAMRRDFGNAVAGLETLAASANAVEGVSGTNGRPGRQRASESKYDLENTALV